MKIALAALGLLVAGSWSVAHAQQEAPRPAAPTLTRPTGATQPVDSRGFIHRWLVLEPVAVQGRLTEAAVEESLKVAALPEMGTALPKHGESITVNGSALAWHALDTLNYNLNLYHFAWALSKPTSNAASSVRVVPCRTASASVDNQSARLVREESSPQLVVAQDPGTSPRFRARYNLPALIPDSGDSQE